MTLARFRPLIRARLLPLVLGVAAALGAGAASAGPVTLPASITEGGVEWFFSALCGSGGPCFEEADLLAPAKPGAFDDFWTLHLNDLPFVPGTTLTTPTTAVAGLEVTEPFFMDKTQPVIRVLLTLHNPGTEAVAVRVDTGGSLGSAENTVVEAKSAGDLLAGPRWWVTSAGSAAVGPVVGTVFYGPGAPAVRPYTWCGCQRGRRGG